MNARRIVVCGFVAVFAIQLTHPLRAQTLNDRIETAYRNQDVSQMISLAQQAQNQGQSYLADSTYDIAARIAHDQSFAPSGRRTRRGMQALSRVIFDSGRLPTTSNGRRVFQQSVNSALWRRGAVNASPTRAQRVVSGTPITRPLNTPSNVVAGVLRHTYVQPAYRGNRLQRAQRIVSGVNRAIASSGGYNSGRSGVSIHRGHNTSSSGRSAMQNHSGHGALIPIK